MITSKKTRLLMLVSALIIGSYSLPSMAGQRDYSNDRHDRYDRREHRQDFRRHDRRDRDKQWKHHKYDRHAWKQHGYRYKPYYGVHRHYYSGYNPQRYIDYHNDARYRISIDYYGR